LSSHELSGFQRTIGRYALFGELAAGGMATVHLGRFLGPVGFSRTVAIKRLHAQFAKDPDFVSMFLDEARLVARIRHPNVVPTLDVVSLEGELFLVMEYVEGESLASLLRRSASRGERAPLAVSVAVMLAVLHGLHAAHEATSERGEPLHIVHRDVSPQNILVGVDGVARVLDFGVAKAAWRLQTTQEGQLKGKLAYMAPEQLQRSDVDRRLDVYAASVVLWEALTGRRLFQGEPQQILAQMTSATVSAPSQLVPGIPPELDRVVLRGLSREVADRFSTAHEMAVALEGAAAIASQREVGEWVRLLATKTLEERAERVAEVESVSSVDLVDHLTTPVKEAPQSAGTLQERAEGDLTPTRMARPSAALQAMVPPFTDPSMSIPRAPDGHRRTFLFGALGAVLVVAAGVVVVRSLSRDHVTTAPAAPSGEGDVAAAPSTTPSVAVPVPSASVAPSLPSSLPSTQPSGPAVAAHPPRAWGAGGRAATPTTHGAPPRNCDPPYTVDATGFKRPKMECL
jgi:serine/threonine-protein kinase